MTRATSNSFVVFKMGDGVQPEIENPSGVFKLKLPIGITMLSGEERTLKLGLSCNFPLHVFESKDMKAMGLRLVDGIWAAHDSYEELTLRMKNTTANELMIERGEVIAKAAVFDNTWLMVSFS